MRGYLPLVSLLAHVFYSCDGSAASMVVGLSHRVRERSQVCPGKVIVSWQPLAWRKRVGRVRGGLCQAPQIDRICPFQPTTPTGCQQRRSAGMHARLLDAALMQAASRGGDARRTQGRQSTMSAPTCTHPRGRPHGQLAAIVMAPCGQNPCSLVKRQAWPTEL